MKTITIIIGNSDDKLTQHDWRNFVTEVRLRIHSYAEEIHFSAGSESTERWQNFAAVICIAADRVEYLRNGLKRIRADYKQDSIAWIEGETESV